MTNEQNNLEILNNHPLIFKAVKLESLISKKTLTAFFKISFAVSLIFLFLFFFYLLSKTSLNIPFLNYFLSYGNLILGIMIIFAGLNLFFCLIYFYFVSVKNSPSIFLAKTSEKENGKKKIYFLDFYGAKLMFYTKELLGNGYNLSKFYNLKPSNYLIQTLIKRLGIKKNDYTEFSNQRNGTENLRIKYEDLINNLVLEAEKNNRKIIGFREFTAVLYNMDKTFQDFLFKRTIRKEEFYGAILWAESSIKNSEKNEKWWEKSCLSRIPGVFKSLNFGFTPVLQKYSTEIYGSSKKFGSKLKFLSRKKEILEIEEILSKSSETNVLLVGEEGVGKKTILEGLSNIINEGFAVPSLENKRMISLSSEIIGANTKTKGNFEETLIKIMNDAVSAGDIILVIENFPEFLKSGAELGTDVLSIIEPYISSRYIQVIAISDTSSFYETLEKNGKINKLFQKIEINEPSREESIYILEDISEIFEKRMPVIITYKAVSSVFNLSDRFITSGAMPEKAINILDRAVTLAVSNGKKYLTEKDINELIQEITRIPTNAPTKEEAEKLLNLEEILKKKIVGQEEAIKTVSEGLRKIRSGLHFGEKRPAGSFLFLGPTGVGKTETAKALAYAYFGSEEVIIRFDMSEYEEEGITKLIGSLTINEPGALTVSLRQKPFSLFLFDEFEKSSKKVLNLFLQILEEGEFKDAKHKKVSARDAIIIATSNAGSNLIWELVKQGKDPENLKKEVIDYIRKQNILSPELLNRFDSIVIFHPLNKDQIKQISRILLEEFAKSLKEKDIYLKITDELVEKISIIGYDPVMGARPIRRAINDKVEQLIAKKILEGKLERGTAIEFTSEEINSF